MLLGELHRVAVFVGIVGDYYLVGIIENIPDKCVDQQSAHFAVVGIAEQLRF